MSYYQSGYPHSSATAGYQSQQYNTQGYYGGSQQQGQYGGGAVRYPQMGSYQHQAPPYTPSQQMNKNVNEQAKQPGASSYQYPSTTGYGQESSAYYLPQNQKNYSTRPNQTVPAYSYNNYSYPTATPASGQTGYVYPYTGNQTNQQQPPLPKQPYTPSTNNSNDVTPQQQQAIQNWIEEKHNTGVARVVGKGSFNRVGGRSRFGPAVPSGTQNKRFQRGGFPRDSQRTANYFCETCKVSCGTSDAYNTHLSGKSHKKKANNPMPTLPNTGKLFKCDVCDVMCTGKDAFKAHIVGTKHKKVVKLYEVMGKPIPEIKDAPIGFSDVPGLGAHLQKTGRPLINFVKSSKELKMKGEGEDEEETTATAETEDTTDQVHSSGGKRKSKSKRKGSRSEKPLGIPLRIGLEGFTDGFGVPLHAISTRDVFVPPPRPDQWQQMEKYFIDTSLRRNRFDDYSILDVHRKIYPSQKELESLYGTLEDVEKSLNVISLKLHHEQIDKLKESLQIAAEEEKPMEGITTDSTTEKDNAPSEQADMNIDDEGKNNSDSVVVQEKGDETDNKNSDYITREQEDSVRVIQGYQRVGDASKGINLSGNLHADLIIICTEKPTKDLLQRIVDMLPPTLADVTKFSYQVTHQPDMAGFQVVYTEEEINVCITVTLTSLDMREQIQEEEAKADESKGVLDRSSCQRALFQMRRTKWFQGQAINLPSYILIIRVLKDISRRVPAWTCMDSWMLELLLQKVLSVTPAEYTRPGDTIRSVVACIASGFFLPGSPGLMDPCEKDKVDASSQLTPQMREDLTFSAQHALRLISFKQLHKVLGLENAPKMQDIKECLSPRVPMRRFSLYRTWRPKRKPPSTPDSEKKQKVEDAPAET